MLRRGAIAWAVVPDQPEAPFPRWVDGAVELVASAAELARRAAGPDVRRPLRVVATAKLRPVVLLQDGPVGASADLVALKLARLGKLPARLRAPIRAERDPAFVPLLRPPAQYGLRSENAVDLTGLVRIHASAFATGAIGQLDRREIERIDRGLPAVWQIDVERHARARSLELWAALLAARIRSDAEGADDKGPDR